MSGKIGAAGRDPGFPTIPDRAFGASHFGHRDGEARLGSPDINWPLKSYLELGALPTAVPCARLYAKQVLWEWNLGEEAEIVEVVVSELVTNAVQASASITAGRYAGRRVEGTPPVRLWLISDQQRIVVQVWDGNDQMPVRQDVDLAAERGRGLMLVESLTASWGAYMPERSSGKVVWALVADPSA